MARFGTSDVEPSGYAARGMVIISRAVHIFPTASSIAGLARRDGLSAEERLSVKLHSNDPLYRRRVQNCPEVAAACQSQAADRHVTLSVGSLATLCAVN